MHSRFPVQIQSIPIDIPIYSAIFKINARTPVSGEEMKTCSRATGATLPRSPTR